MIINVDKPGDVTLTVRLSYADAQALYALLDFPNYARQDSQFVDVWCQFSSALDMAFGGGFKNAGDAGMTDETSV